MLTGYLRIPVWMTVALIAGSAFARPRDGGDLGPYRIGHTSFVVATPEGRPVAVDVWYPADDEDSEASLHEAVYVMDPYTLRVGTTTSSEWEALGYDRAFEAAKPKGGRAPLVMFSSGLSASGWSYLYLGTRLASHGYMVAVVEHFAEATWLWDGWEGMGRSAFDRPRDLSFALTELLRRNATRGDLLQASIDESTVIAAGHSYGGYAAMVEAAGDDQICDSQVLARWGELKPADCHPTAPDPRFSAVVSFSSSSWMLRWEELARIQVPFLHMGEADLADGSFPPQTASQIARPHAAAVSSGSRSLRIDVGVIDHFGFSNACDGTKILFDKGAITQADWDYNSVFCLGTMNAREGHRLITKYALAFLDGEVLGKQNHWNDITLSPRDAIANEPNIEIYWNETCASPAPAGYFTYLRDMNGTCAMALQNPTQFF